MQYDYLGELLVIARCGTFSAAAGELGVSQPSLGRHLGALEAELGVKLLDRGSVGVSNWGHTAQNRVLHAESFLSGAEFLYACTFGQGDLSMGLSIG